MRNFRPSLPWLTTSLLATLLAACDPGFESTDGNDGDDGGSDTVVEQFYGAGGGSTWLLDLEDDDDFILRERPRIGGNLLTTVRGEHEQLSSGFSRLVVASATGNTEPPEDTELPALYLEDQLLLTQDWSRAGRLMMFVPQGACPTADFSANWVETLTPPNRFANSGTESFFGTFTRMAAAEEIQVDQHFGLTPDFPEQDATDPITAGACTSGASVAGDTRIYYGANNTAFVQRGAGTTGESNWLAFPRRQLTSADLSGEYIGFWLDNSRSGTNRLWFVTMSCANEDCTVERITDIEDLNSTANQSFQITLDEERFDEPAEGFVGGVIDSSVGFETRTGNIMCSASDDFNGTSDKLLVCVGQTPGNSQFAVQGYFVAQN